MELARKSCHEPATLGADDLEPLRVLVGDGALDYTLVVGSFHFINRIADLLDVDPELVPRSMRRFEWLRRLGVRMAGKLMSRMDLANRAYPLSYQQALDELAPVYERAAGRPPGELFAPAATRPWFLEMMRLALEERLDRSTLDDATVATIERTVESALPTCRDDATGLHARPSDPVEAFAFVGTRYAQRTTADMIGRLRDAGYDDVGILDLAIAVADANQWARVRRLIGLQADPYALARAGAEPDRASA